MPHLITERCIGCTACVKVCPVEAITGVNKELHHINPAICIDCGACTYVCPEECIENPAGITPERIRRRTDWPKPEIIDELCTGCNFCVDICPFDCLELDDRAFGGIARLVDPKACVGCAMCEEVCAKNAIIVKDNRSFSVRNPRLASAYSYSR
jgi:Uncharacterized Fe-S center protein